jgi:hypothetical protein
MLTSLLVFLLDFLVPVFVGLFSGFGELLRLGDLPRLGDLAREEGFEDFLVFDKSSCLGMMR